MIYPPQGGPQQMPPPGYAAPPPAPAMPGGHSRAMGVTAAVLAIFAALVALEGGGWSGFNVIRDVADTNPMTKLLPLQAAAGGLLVVGVFGLLAVVLAFRSRLWLLPKLPAYPQQHPGYQQGQAGYGQHPQQWR